MTMRTLVIMRHAKAEAPERYDRDVDRPLVERGRGDAAAAGAWLVERGLVPELVICSPAVRARETLRSVVEGLGAAQPTVVYEPALYTGGVTEALDLVAATQPALSRVLLIGHNPTLTMVSGLLEPAGHAPEADLADFDADGLRTAGLAVHQLDGTWADFGPGAAKLVDAHTARAAT